MAANAVAVQTEVVGKQPGQPTANKAEKEKKAFDALLLKANGGDGKALYQVGCCYKNGSLGVEEDSKAAFEYFERSAHKGYRSGQTKLGISYLNGVKNVVAVNLPEAIKFLLLAAAQDESCAENNLGICFLDGNGVEKDLKKALDYFVRAYKHGEEKHAPNNITFTANKLGQNYLNGVEVEKNQKIAQAYFKLATAKKEEVMDNFTAVTTLLAKEGAANAVSASGAAEKAEPAAAKPTQTTDSGDSKPAADAVVVVAAASQSVAPAAAPLATASAAAAAPGTQVIVSTDSAAAGSPLHASVLNVLAASAAAAAGAAQTDASKKADTAATTAPVAVISAAGTPVVLGANNKTGKDIPTIINEMIRELRANIKEAAAKVSNTGYTQWGAQVFASLAGWSPGNPLSKAVGGNTPQKKQNATNIEKILESLVNGDAVAKSAADKAITDLGKEAAVLTHASFASESISVKFEKILGVFTVIDKAVGGGTKTIQLIQKYQRLLVEYNFEQRRIAQASKGPQNTLPAAAAAHSLPQDAQPPLVADAAAATAPPQTVAPAHK